MILSKPNPSIETLPALSRRFDDETDKLGSARAIIDIALAAAERPLVATNFRPGAAALLHLVLQARPGLPVLWVDTGYNTAATLDYIAALRERWDFDLRRYAPRVATYLPRSTSRRNADLDDFARVVKLEPFQRAFDALNPDLWFTGIRRSQSAFRKSLGAVSRGYRNTLRVAPLYHWRDSDVAAYLAVEEIPDNPDYTDPTKPSGKRECGIHRLS